MTDWTSYNEFIARYNIDTVVSMVAFQQGWLLKLQVLGTQQLAQPAPVLWKQDEQLIFSSNNEQKTYRERLNRILSWDCRILEEDEEASQSQRLSEGY
ncbi:Uncharacterized protein TCM_042717 [Theobroma cacao]|uniref:Uncharacterized protein n=1 Tax=Theobroma cacao TaxID=3641 RepID=A0A061FL63_THECC|nr:Uncharacterized protein TCM_042717 [Theobroma cacao]